MFMADAIRIMDQGADALLTLRPAWFNWPLFLVALALIATPVLDLWRQWRSSSAA